MTPWECYKRRMIPTLQQRIVDSVLNVAKAIQRKYYYTAYAAIAARRKARELEGPPQAATFPAPIRSILIFKPDEIGDSVYALPAIHHLKNAFPNARFFLIAQPKTVALFQSTGLFEKIGALHVKTRAFRFYFPDLKRALAELGDPEIDLAIFMRTYPTYFKDFLKIPARYHWHPEDPRMKSNSPYRVPLSLGGEGERKHMAIQLMELVEPLTQVRPSFQNITFPKFNWSEKDRRAVESVVGDVLEKPFLAIHPFGKFETKHYPFEYWEKLVDQFHRELNVSIVVVGAPEDGRFIERPFITQTQGKLTIAQTGLLLSHAAGFIGIWSGPGHLASVLGIPTVTIASGLAIVSEWAPLERSLFLRTDVPCAPCHRFTCPPSRNVKCLKALPPEKIYPIVRDFFASPRWEIRTL